MEVINGTPKECEIAMQQKAREGMITHMLSDIKFDMTVCELMGTNKMEYIRILKDELDKLYDDEIYNRCKNKNIGRGAKKNESRADVG